MKTMRPVIVMAFLLAGAPLAYAGSPTVPLASTGSSPSLFDKMYGTVFGPAPVAKHAAAAPKLHDSAHPVLRSAHAVPHEPAGAPVVMAMHHAAPPARPSRPIVADASLAPSIHYASFTVPSTACDSLLCPNYAILGVGF